MIGYNHTPYQTEWNKPHYNIVLRGAAPPFFDTKYFSFSMFKTDHVSHFDLKSKI
jgi:hypothetical protein